MEHLVRIGIYQPLNVERSSKTYLEMIFKFHIVFRILDSHRDTTVSKLLIWQSYDLKPTRLFLFK